MYQNFIKCFSNYIPIKIIPSIQNELGRIKNEEEIDIVIAETIDNKDVEKPDTEIETYQSIEELKYPQEFEDWGIILLDNLKEREMNDPRVEAMFKRSGHINLSIIIIS